MDFSQSDEAGQGRSIIICGENLCFLRITYNYAGREKSLINDICCWNLSVGPSQISIPVIHRDSNSSPPILLSQSFRIQQSRSMR
jgi:hypothetical protein